MPNITNHCMIKDHMSLHSLLLTTPSRSRYSSRVFAYRTLKRHGMFSLHIEKNRLFAYHTLNRHSMFSLLIEKNLMIRNIIVAIGKNTSSDLSLKSL